MNEISPKIIRVWFDTVLNPIIDGLNIENSYLKKNNLSWRGFNNTFEIFKPLQTNLQYRFIPNFEQLSDYYPIVSEIIEKHNEELTILYESCFELFETLKNSHKLKKIYDQIIEDFFKNKPIVSDIQKNDFLESRNYRIISEYIINNIDELDTYYTFHPIWNPNKEIFKNILNEDEFNQLHLKLQDSISNFNEIVNKSIKDLKDLRNRLSILYGEPIVMPDNKDLTYA